MRASIATHSSAGAPSASWVRASCATISRLSTGTTGLLAPKASPCATEHAVRRPVNAPGPQPNAMASSSCKVQPPSANMASSSGTSRAEALAPPASSRVRTPCGVSSARLIASVEVSKASRRVMGRSLPGALPSTGPMRSSPHADTRHRARPLRGLRGRPDLPGLAGQRRPDRGLATRSRRRPDACRRAPRSDGRGGAGGRRFRGTPRLAAAAASEPGVADEARHHQRGARPARPRLGVEHAGVGPGQHAQRRARRQPRHQGQRRPEVRAGAPVAGAAPRAAAGRARDPGRHRARPQHLQPATAQPGRLRRQALQPAEHRPRCAAAQLQVGAADLHTRPRTRPGRRLQRAAAGRCAHRPHGAAVGAGRLQRLARGAATRLHRPAAHPLHGPLPGELRRAVLAGRLCRPRELQRPRARRSVARNGRQARGAGSRRSGAG